MVDENLQWAVAMSSGVAGWFPYPGKGPLSRLRIVQMSAYGCGGRSTRARGIFITLLVGVAAAVTGFVVLIPLNRGGCEHHCFFSYRLAYFVFPAHRLALVP